MNCVAKAKVCDDQGKVVCSKQVTEELPAKYYPSETRRMIAMFNALEKGIGIAAASGVFVAFTCPPYIGGSAEDRT